MRQLDKPCLLCGHDCVIIRGNQWAYTEYECPTCGKYAISDYFNQHRTRKIFSSMYYFVLHYNNNDEKHIYFVKDASVFTDNEARYIDIKMLENRYPKNLNDKIDLVMLNLSKKIQFLGQEFELSDLDDSSDNLVVSYYNLFFIEDNGFELWELGKQVDEMMIILQEYDYIKHLNILGDNVNSYTFTANGWNHVNTLQSKYEELPQAFIAMWFSDEMKTARDAIINAIKNCGYMPVIIDDKEHNNQIVPEILFEIQRSKFMVADITGHRNGVYFEAGYAQALNKEVILSCRDTDFSDRHFDVAQKNTIRWSEEDDLYKRLMKRIEATVGMR